MKKCIMLLVVMAVCSAAMAAPFDINISASNGVPYTVTPGSNAPTWMQAMGTFETFCVEKDRYFSPNPGDYSATIDDYVYYGEGTLLNPDPKNLLTEEVKRIYAAFLNGELTNALQVQHAIWHNRGYEPSSGDAYKDADDAIKAVYTDDIKSTGRQNVKVLNLWLPGFEYQRNTGSTKYDIQSQLVMVPVPGAYLLGALGLGVANWRLKRRRNA